VEGLCVHLLSTCARAAGAAGAPCPHAGQPIDCKAAIAWDSKKKLDVTTVTVDPPGPGEVRVKIVATALCHTVSGARREGRCG
jgi:S-(hydroxymethyl)glutathione dehydrogenase/alcohol dehydrogenase